MKNTQTLEILMDEFDKKLCEPEESFTDKLSDIHHRLLILELDSAVSDDEAESLAPIKQAFDEFWRNNYEQKDMVFYRST